MLAVFLNQILLWYLPKSNFLFGWSKNLRCSKIRTLVEEDPGPPLNSEDGAICNNSLRLKSVYQSIVTRSSILNAGSGPRPAFDYNGI